MKPYYQNDNGGSMNQKTEIPISRKEVLWHIVQIAAVREKTHIQTLYLRSGITGKRATCSVRVVVDGGP